MGIGGAPDEYRKAGEPVDPRERAALTDEMLEVVRALLAGETVTHRGPALVVDDVTLAPLPVQAPIPVWVGGGSRGARRRAARHDGWIPVTVDDEGRPCLTPDDVGAALVEIRAERLAAGVAPGAPFIVGIHGETPGPGEDGAAIVRPLGRGRRHLVARDAPRVARLHGRPVREGGRGSTAGLRAGPVAWRLPGRPSPAATAGAGRYRRSRRASSASRSSSAWLDAGTSSSPAATPSSAQSHSRSWRSRRRPVRSRWIGVTEMRRFTTAWKSVPGTLIPDGGGPPIQ